MAEGAASLLPWLAALLLGVGLTRQFVVSGRTGLLLDRLAILPQWKFFGQAGIASDPFAFDDLHLIARIGTDATDWQPLLWSDERRAIDALWNPGPRARSALTEAMTHLAHSEDPGSTSLRPTAISYLTVLRHCLDRLRPGEGEAIQFAIVHSRGRPCATHADRPVALRFLSAWHSA